VLIMDLLQLAMTLSQDATRRELLSARPDAPVRPDHAPVRHRPRAARSRTSLAHLLERAARWVAPTPSCTPLR
jgi:hypothetical protein